MDRFKISVSSLATQDVQHILLWYQEIEPTLATKFCRSYVSFMNASQSIQNFMGFLM